LKPNQLRHSVETNPQLESVYFKIFQWLNFLCKQFDGIKKIQCILYKRIKWKSSKDKYLMISPASHEKDEQVVYDEKGLPNL